METDAYLVLVVVALVGWVAWLLLQRSRMGLELERQRMATLARLVDKFPSAESFVAFVESSKGQLLLNSGEREATALRTVLRFVQMGIVVAAVGLALLWSASHLLGATDAHSLQQRAEWSWWGVSLLGLGGGLISAGCVSLWFARHFKMLEDSRKAD